MIRKTSGHYTYCVHLHEQGLFNLRRWPIRVALVSVDYVGRIGHRHIGDIASYLVPSSRDRDPAVRLDAGPMDHVEFQRIEIGCHVDGCVFYRGIDDLLISYSHFEPLHGNGGDLRLMIYDRAWPDITEIFS